MTPTAEDLPWAVIGAPGMFVQGREHEYQLLPLEFGGLSDDARSTMTEVWFRAALWLGLALAATLISKVETPSTAGPVPDAVRLGEREG